MEWWKLFSGTFILIFLAELGDKTQLAAMAKTADTPGSSAAKWVVFLGASLALASSTFIAVFAGHFLKRLVPDERYIRLAAALLFLAFGVLMLREVWLSFRGGAQPTATAGGDGRTVAGALALRGAMELESFVVQRYQRLAECASPALRSVLLDLAREEEGHLSRLRRLTEGAEQVFTQAESRNERLECGLDAPEGDDLLALAAHEEATAEFYRKLADKARLPGMAAALSGLALEERGHAERLRALASNRLASSSM